MILITKTSDQTRQRGHALSIVQFLLKLRVPSAPPPVCMYVCIFIKLHITAQSGLVILVILCHSR